MRQGGHASQDDQGSETMATTGVFVYCDQTFPFSDLTKCLQRLKNSLYKILLG